MTYRIIPIAVIVVMVAVAAWFATGLFMKQNNSKVGSDLIVADFELQDTSGNRVTAKDFSGKPMLVYFGFTYCPDVCPTELMRLGQVLDDLGEQSKQINTILISVDPERDTPESMKAYLEVFHPEIIGLTGNPDQIKDAARAFRVYYARVDDPSSAVEYTMDHSAFVYLMDENGKYLTHFSPDTDIELMLQRIRNSL